LSKENDDNNAIETVIKEMEGYQGRWFKADASYIRSLTPECQENIRIKVKEWIPKLKQDAWVVCEEGQCRSHEISSLLPVNLINSE